MYSEQVFHILTNFFSVSTKTVKKAYLSLIKGQEEVRGPGEDAPGAINEVIPSRNRVRITFQHGGSLDQLCAGIFHSVERRKKTIKDWLKQTSQKKSCQ